MPLAKKTNVRMGEIAVADVEGVLCTLLGSCVGVILYDRSNSIGGLAHVVLPDSRGKSELPGKYVDTAIPELLRQLDEAGTNRRSLRARLAGAPTCSTPEPMEPWAARIWRQLKNYSNRSGSPFSAGTAAAIRDGV